MDPKDRTEAREYNRGYQDGNSGKASNDGSNAFAALVTLGLGGAPRSGADSYRQGYQDGKEDRKR